jgi:type IV pilus assembly protein PilY1
MIYSIPSDIACIDTKGDNFIDRFYVGDMGGRIWRFDIKDVSEKDDPTKWKGKIIFTASGKIHILRYLKRMVGIKRYILHRRGKS